MFSFIKWIQATLSQLKRNKGLWFTTLTVLSVTGILTSIYVIHSMTTNVAHQTYMEERRTDINQLESLLLNRYDGLLTISSILSLHPQIIGGIKQKQNKNVQGLLDMASRTINANVNLAPIDMHYYAKNYKVEQSENHDIAKLVLETGQSISGIVVNKKGVRIIGIVPIRDNNITIGAVSASQSIHALKDDFERIGKEFTFLLAKQQLVFIGLEHKQGMYKKINDNYSVAFHNYDSPFYTHAEKIDFELLEREKYHNDPFYYTTTDPIIDLNGRTIGLAFIGENSDNANSFVQITKNMINSVTTVALGLVISLIMFMF